MRYIRIELAHYKRLSHLTGLKGITIDFKQPVHLLLGTNGSGKSSLMDELTLYPSSPQHYGAFGCKKIWFEDQGVTYCSISHLNPTHYSLLDETNNQYLAKQVNMTQMKELCRVHFKMTPKTELLQKGWSLTQAISPLDESL